MKQITLSRYSGVSHQYVGHICTGKCKAPSIAIMAKLARGMNMPLSEFVAHWELDHHAETQEVHWV